MSDETGNAPRGGFGKWWIASAVLMAVVVLGLVYVLFPRGDDATGADTDTDASSSPSTATDSPSSTTATTAPEEGGEGWDDEGCNGTEGSSEIPTSAPDDVQWVPIGAVAVPMSAAYGPTDVAQSPLRQCFQHSPTGALFATINIISVAASSPDAALAVAGQQITPGAERDRLVSAAKRGEVGSPGALAAFRISACDPQRCLVELVMEGSGVKAQVTYSLVWTGGDWLADGSVAVSGGAVDEIPAGFALWSPGM